MMPMPRPLALLLAQACLVSLVSAHGYFTVPASRVRLAAISSVDTEYCPHCVLGTGTPPAALTAGRNYPGTQPFAEPGTTPSVIGPCGMTNSGSRSFNQPTNVFGEIVDTFAVGDIVEVEWQVNAYHRGVYSYRVCTDQSLVDPFLDPNNTPTQADFDAIEVCLQDGILPCNAVGLDNDNCAGPAPDTHLCDPLWGCNNPAWFGLASQPPADNTFRDRVRLPAGYQSDHTLLTWRWDSLDTTEYYLNCADIQIGEAGDGFTTDEPEATDPPETTDAAATTTSPDGEATTAPDSPESTLAPVQPLSGCALSGVNLAGAEFGGNSIPGVFGTDYIYPLEEEVDYFVGKGMNVFRIPFRWERLQRTLGGAFDQAELARLRSTVDYITSHEGSTALNQGGSSLVYAILDPHNYARYNDEIIDGPGSSVTSDDFDDFWSRLASEFSDDLQVIFNIMNEPSELGNDGTELWLSVCNSAIGAIRDAGAENLLLVPGNYFTGAHSWVNNFVDGSTPNAQVMDGVVDPLDNFAFDMHQYFDSDRSGTSDQCNARSELLSEATAWLRQFDHRAVLGEIGVGRNENCLDTLDDVLEYLSDNHDAWLGYTYWAAGPWWDTGATPYIFSLEPANDFQEDRPQMDTIEEHLPPVGLSEAEVAPAISPEDGDGEETDTDLEETEDPNVVDGGASEEDSAAASLASTLLLAIPLASALSIILA